MTSFSHGALGAVFERGGQLCDLILGQVFDRHAEARESLSASIRRSTCRSLIQS